eukprot:TRINITY_DN11848_c0_g1_i2.p1 TRINITY_DN11848_c0_g1~~TRINITY_DN11848_c0_g1_i2.p1  ORF type:complete len:1698 (+),score=337.73 TRINITY_DN11848_c0_g1_i2:110-5095(+)
MDAAGAHDAAPAPGAAAPRAVPPLSLALDEGGGDCPSSGAEWARAALRAAAGASASSPPAAPPAEPPGTPPHPPGQAPRTPPRAGLLQPDGSSLGRRHSAALGASPEAAGWSSPGSSPLPPLRPSPLAMPAPLRGSPAPPPLPSASAAVPLRGLQGRSSAAAPAADLSHLSRSSPPSRPTLSQPPSPLLHPEPVLARSCQPSQLSFSAAGADAERWPGQPVPPQLHAAPDAMTPCVPAGDPGVFPAPLYSPPAASCPCTDAALAAASGDSEAAASAAGWSAARSLYRLFAHPVEHPDAFMDGAVAAVLREAEEAAGRGDAPHAARHCCACLWNYSMALGCTDAALRRGALRAAALCVAAYGLGDEMVAWNGLCAMYHLLAGCRGADRPHRPGLDPPRPPPSPAAASAVPLSAAAGAAAVLAAAAAAGCRKGSEDWQFAAGRLLGCLLIPLVTLACAVLDAFPGHHGMADVCFAVVCKAFDRARSSQEAVELLAAAAAPALPLPPECRQSSAESRAAELAAAAVATLRRFSGTRSSSAHPVGPDNPIATFCAARWAHLHWVPYQLPRGAVDVCLDGHLKVVHVLTNLSCIDQLKVLLCRSGAAEIVVAAMRDYPDTERLQLAAAGVLWNLGMVEANRAAMGEAGCCEVLAEALRRHEAHPRVLQGACTALYYISRLDDRNTQRLCRTSTVEALVRCCSRHLRTHHNIVHSSTTLLLRISGISPDVVATADVPALTVELLRAWAHDQGITQNALGLIWNLTAARTAHRAHTGSAASRQLMGVRAADGSSICRSALLDRGALGLVVDTLEHFRASPDAATRGLIALWHLAADPVGAARFAERGGVRVCCAIAQQHVAVEDPLTFALGCLQIGARDAAGAAELVRHGGIALLCEAVQYHVSSRACSERAAELLLRISVDHGSELVSGGGLAAVMAICARHPGAERVAAAALGVLSSLAVHPSLREAVVAAGGISTAVKCLRLHAASSSVLAWRASAALFRLSVLDSACDAIADPAGGGIATLVHTLQAGARGPGDDSTASNILGCLWNVSMPATHKAQVIPHLRAILASMQQHAGMREVQHRGCTLLYHLMQHQPWLDSLQPGPLAPLDSGDSGSGPSLTAVVIAAILNGLCRWTSCSDNVGLQLSLLYLLMKGPKTRGFVAVAVLGAVPPDCSEAGCYPGQMAGDPERSAAGLLYSVLERHHQSARVMQRAAIVLRDVAAFITGEPLPALDAHYRQAVTSARRVAISLLLGDAGAEPAPTSPFGDSALTGSFCGLAACPAPPYGWVPGQPLPEARSTPAASPRQGAAASPVSYSPAFLPATSPLQCPQSPAPESVSPLVGPADSVHQAQQQQHCRLGASAAPRGGPSPPAAAQAAAPPSPQPLQLTAIAVAVPAPPHDIPSGRRRASCDDACAVPAPAAPLLDILCRVLASATADSCRCGVLDVFSALCAIVNADCPQRLSELRESQRLFRAVAPHLLYPVPHTRAKAEEVMCWIAPHISDVVCHPLLPRLLIDAMPAAVWGAPGGGGFAPSAAPATPAGPAPPGCPGGSAPAADGSEGCGPAGVLPCSVCLTEYVSGDTLIRLPCHHAFHRECVADWLTESGGCPLCRQSVAVSLASPSVVAAVRQAMPRREAMAAATVSAAALLTCTVALVGFVKPWPHHSG